MVPANDTEEWALFTKRTDDPKLRWLELKLREAGVPSRRSGRSWHAPILEVPASRLGAAWGILTPVDEVPDDDSMFQEEEEEEEEAT